MLFKKWILVSYFYSIWKLLAFFTCLLPSPVILQTSVIECSALAFYCCCNKFPQTWSLKKAHLYFLTVLEERSLKSVLLGWNQRALLEVLGKILFSCLFHFLKLHFFCILWCWPFSPLKPEVSICFIMWTHLFCSVLRCNVL